MEKNELTKSANAQKPAEKKESALAIANRQGSLVGLKQKDIGEVLGAYKDQVAGVLPKHLTAERIIQMAATEAARNPEVLSCTPASLVGYVLQASTLGFQPVSALGYCYPVPYFNKKTGRKEVQFQIGYKGFLSLARRSGEILTVNAEVVREGDKFEYRLGLHRDLVHEPTGDISKDITHSYATVEFKDGGATFVVLSKAEIERLRMRSNGQGPKPSGAWATDYEAMAKAKALKQLAKYLPLTIDEANAIATDGAVLNPDNFEKDGHVKMEDVEYELVDETTGEVLTEEQIEAEMDKSAEQVNNKPIEEGK